MKVAVIHDWNVDLEQEATWCDGLAAAINILGKKHEVRFFAGYGTEMELKGTYFPIYLTPEDKIVERVKEYAPDVILHWADFSRPTAQPMRELGIPMAICFAAGEAVNYNTPYFDHIFVESKVYMDKLNSAGYDNVSIAFGTNTELFKPIDSQAKIFDAMMAGTFAIWKRYNLFAGATKDMLACAVGYMYPDSWEKECYEDCEKAGDLVLPHVSAQALHRLYAASKCVVIPSRSDGGSQRTVLEAMAMNVPLIVTDSDKFDYVRGQRVFVADPTVESIRGYIEAILDGGTEVNTRDYVVENWSEYNYAYALEKGLESLLK